MSAETPEVESSSSTASVQTTGNRNVGVGRDVRNSTIITGDANTIFIGARVPWLRIGIGLAIIAVLAVAGYFLYPRPIPVMTGDLNVMVAEFGALDAQGKAVQSAEARGLADSLFSTLSSELPGLNAASAGGAQPLQIQVWGPSQVGRIDGDTPDARAARAEQVARQANAHLLIYGYLQQTNVATLVPRFYLRNLQETPELEGEHDLGESVPVRSLDDPDSRATLRADLTGRSRGMAEFVIGLSQFTNDKIADARVHFNNAANDPGWADGPGKQVLYLFLGFAEGRLDHLSDARTNFQRALAIDRQFTRAYLGLGEVRFQESIGRPDACTRGSTDVDGIRDAIAIFETAQQSTQQPPGSNVGLMSHLQVGRAYLCLSQAEAGDYWPDAERELHQSISLYDPATSNESARELTADAHAQLGFVLLPQHCDPQRQAKYASAAAEYQNAIDLSTFHPARAGFYYEMLGFIHNQVGDLDQARKDYQNAMRVDATNNEHYMQLLSALAPPVSEVCP
jgi:tetratricopeptide (TPR) repeat protein